MEGNFLRDEEDMNVSILSAASNWRQQTPARNGKIQEVDPMEIRRQKNNMSMAQLHPTNKKGYPVAHKGKRAPALSFGNEI